MIWFLTSAEAEVPERDVFPQTSFIWLSSAKIKKKKSI